MDGGVALVTHSKTPKEPKCSRTPQSHIMKLSANPCGLQDPTDSQNNNLSITMLNLSTAHTMHFVTDESGVHCCLEGTWTGTSKADGFSGDFTDIMTFMVSRSTFQK